ncbi:MAG: ubiquinone/menaquinone biosynthesis methyltransferase [Dehalococcoidales bacterium]|nr:ubiquinone/menaquinone biosynthesis methyltransferase [Dehalococcoidales bacterium]
MNTPEDTQASRPLHGMFTAVPPRYDLVNHIITLGMDTRWRKLAARTCLENNPQRVLDLGCGTGDLALTIARFSGHNTGVTGLDYSPPMLERARRKASASGLSVEFIHGDAAQTPFPDGHFDCVGISFAFRNLTYKNPLCEPHLAEVLRILKPGGRYVIVESSQPENAFIRAGFRLYLRAFVSPVGMMLSGNKGAYNYLASSAAHYYSAPEVRDMLLKAGFGSVSYRPLFFGAAGIHIASR